MKPSLLPCGCEDGSCKQCLAILDLDEMISKTSIVCRNVSGEITMIYSTRQAMEYKRIMKEKK